MYSSGGEVGDLVFSTRNSTTASTPATERMRSTSDGNITTEWFIQARRFRCKYEYYSYTSGWNGTGCNGYFIGLNQFWTITTNAVCCMGHIAVSATVVY